MVAQLARAGGLELDPGVTFLVGDNGTGKSTLVEALAAAAGFNAEGGSQSFRFATRATDSSRWVITGAALGHHQTPHRVFPARRVVLQRSHRDRPARIRKALPALPAYGGRSLHERSHGESFLDLVTHRFGPGGLYLLDEPEAALSVRGCLAMVALIADLSPRGSQFVVATHSPILLAVPGARILQIEPDGQIEQVSYDRADPVALTRGFLTDPDRFLHHLFSDES